MLTRTAADGYELRCISDSCVTTFGAVVLSLLPPPQHIIQ